MGYDQYWLAVPELPQGAWDRMVGDFARVAASLHGMGLRLAGPDGTGAATINGDVLAFNGVRDCGHGRRDARRRMSRRRAGVVWPDEIAVRLALSEASARGGGGRGMAGRIAPSADAAAAAAVGVGAGVRPAFGRAPIRSCDGTCATGPFVMHRTMPRDEYTKVYGDVASPVSIDGIRGRVPREWVGKYFSRCRTRRLPYDLAVCCALLAAKRRFGSLVAVSSDGTDAEWSGARGICQRVLGYGADMGMSPRTGRMRCAAGTRTPAAPDMSGRHVPVYSPDGDGLELWTVGRLSDGGALLVASGDGEDAPAAADATAAAGEEAAERRRRRR